MIPVFGEAGDADERRAEGRGEARAKLVARIEANEQAIREQRQDHSDLKAEVTRWANAQERLTDNVREKDIAEQTLTTAAEKAIARQITRREFNVAVVTILVMLTGVIVAVITTAVK
jgi:hypothetical protein